MSLNTDTILNKLATKENILASLGLFVIFIAISLLAGFAWGLLTFGIGLLAWGVGVAATKLGF